MRRSLRALVSRTLVALTWGLALVACRSNGTNGATGEAPDAQASPQASAVAAPLATVTPSADPADPTGAGPPPVALRGDQPVAADVLGERALAGYSIEATLHLAELALPPRGGEASASTAAAEDAQRKATEPRVVVEMGASRMRWVFASGAFPVLPGTELRARADRYGFLLLVPAWAAAAGTSVATYATLAPGTLHALLDDRRLDVGPTLGVEVLGRGEVGKRAASPAPSPSLRRIEVITGAGHALVDFSRHEGLGDGGILLTRLLLDALGVPPSTRLAQPDELPSRVELRIAPRGQIVFEVTAVTRRSDLDPALLSAPPVLAEYRENPLRPDSSGLLVSAADLAGFRAPGGSTPDAGSGDGNGVSLFNATDRVRYAALDGVPVAWLAPGARINVPAPRGHYLLQWRTFFGDELSAVESIPVPSVHTLGGLDAGLAPTLTSPTSPPPP